MIVSNKTKKFLLAPILPPNNRAYYKYQIWLIFTMVRACTILAIFDHFIEPNIKKVDISFINFINSIIYSCLAERQFQLMSRMPSRWGQVYQRLQGTLCPVDQASSHSPLPVCSLVTHYEKDLQKSNPRLGGP